MNKLAGVVLLGFAICGAVFPCAGLTAQRGAVVSEQQPGPEVQPNAPSTILLKEGTEVKLELAQTVTGKSAVVGEPIEMALAEDLRVGEVVVARKGTRVMGTVIEGDLDSVLRVIRQMHEAPFKAGALRVSTLIKIDDRRDHPEHTMAEKIRAVEEKL